MSGDEAMTPGRWARIEALFAEAEALPPGRRSAFLEREATDPGIRAEVESLLAAHDADPRYLEDPPWLGGAAPESDPIAAPDRIGDYRVLRPIGRGGMGQVFLAEREAEAFRRTVAIKIMRRGLDTDDLVRRFRAERQILATLDHPNIARLLDVGATGDGRPYFVMEYVEGRTLLEHCERRELGVRQRVELFQTVCEAVHHAHQSLVVHRDLKPGNILVTDAGVPKLLDFGIAKILDPEREGLATTRAGERLLTPEYSAPEQIEGAAITTATDVYALGVLLYELLAGRHPLADRRGDRAMIRGVMEADPPPPSAVAAAARKRALSGDLDTIVGKAMRKEPEARYASALSLAEDLERHRTGRPVEARPATLRYLARRFIRRNRGAVATAAAVVALLIGFTTVTAYQGLRIRQEAAQVRAERDKALQVRSFLLETFGATGPEQATGDSVAVRELLDRRAATLGESYRDPELHAEMTGVLAEAYEQLGLFAEAEPLARRALAQKLELYGMEHPDVAVSYNVLGWILRQAGELEAAESTLREAVRVGRATFPGGDARLARALNDLGVVLEARGEYDEAAGVYRESLAMRRRVLGAGHVGVAVTTSNLAVVLYRRGAVDSAAAMAAEAVEAFQRALGEDHQRTLYALGNLAALRAVQGDHAGAAAVYARILERHRRVLGDDHPQVAYALGMRANQLVTLERHREAEPLVREALAIQRAAFGARDERVAQTLRVLGDVLHYGGRLEPALGRFQEALGIVRAELGEDHKEVAVLRLRMARVRERLGRYERAATDYAAATRGFETALGTEHYLTAEALLARAEFYLARGRPGDARPLVADAGPVIDGLGEAFVALQDRLATVRAALDEPG
jgi:serine/threonine-protein kinase